ncbi:MAG: hypothetical protein WD512_17475 [Candidatus Paceibacterota bacterium]
MKHSLALNQQLDCNTVCKIIMDLMNIYQHNNGDISECLLVMEIKKPIEQIDSSSILNIEHKE